MEELSTNGLSIAPFNLYYFSSLVQGITPELDWSIPFCLCLVGPSCPLLAGPSLSEHLTASVHQGIFHPLTSIGLVAASSPLYGTPSTF